MSERNETPGGSGTSAAKQPSAVDKLGIAESQWISSNEFAFVVQDKHPVSPGHLLVVPKRLVPSWWHATLEERIAIMELVDRMKEELDRTMRPDGYNVGFNTGAAAGQVSEYLHVHIIPRFRGDVADPIGGIRHVIPEKASYPVASPTRTRRM